MKYNNNANDLIKFISKATSPFHVVMEGITILEKSGFKKLELTDQWQLKHGGKYYTSLYDSSLVAFTIGDEVTEDTDFRIIASHTDHPCLKIKPSSDLTEKSYLKVNTDVYGGAIYNTWMDRPLSVAGKVALRSNDVFRPNLRFIDIRKPILTIPNLAIHMNREVNKGVELNKQKDMLPLAGIINDTLNKNNYFIEFLSKQLDVSPEDILDFDLYIYNTEHGQIIGMYEDFISAPRLDNLTSVFASVKNIILTNRRKGINLIAAFDNEEIGSRTKQGADSTILPIVLEKIYEGLLRKKTGYHEAIMKSMMLSVDVSHGYHPNKPEKSDPTNVNILNNGVVLKIDLNQKYASDTEAVAIVQQLCDKNDIKYQKYVNRSDLMGGSTLGTITSAWLPMKTVDLGVPLLAMHSARELMGKKDQTYLDSLMNCFFSHEA